MGYRQGSRTVPIALAKMQVNDSVDLGDTIRTAPL